MIEIHTLTVEDLSLIAEIDRSEQVNFAYRVEQGILKKYAVDWDVPSWYQYGTGEHSVHRKIAGLRPVLTDGGLLLGAYDQDTLLGLAVIQPRFEPGMARLAFLHVSRPHRGRGVGKALWAEAELIARTHNATKIYVSATPSGPTVDFYRNLGCTLAATPHPALFAMEPEDIHLVRAL